MPRGIPNKTKRTMSRAASSKTMRKTTRAGTRSRAGPRKKK